MARIFEREDVEQILPYVRPILADLKTCLKELHLTLRRKEQGDAEAEYEFRAQRQDLRRHVNELERVGCCVRNPGEVEVLFPAVKGSQMGFYHLRPGAKTVDRWTAAHGNSSEHKHPTARAFP